MAYLVTAYYPGRLLQLTKDMTQFYDRPDAEKPHSVEFMEYVPVFIGFL